VPGLSGNELLERLLQSCPETQIICLSGFDDATNGVPDFRQITFLQKPFAPRQLLNSIQSCFADSDLPLA